MTTNQTYADGQGNVSGDALNTFVQTCPTVSYARSFVGVSGMEMALQGYDSPGDGGDGTFYWNTANANSDDGGVTTIVPNGSGSGAWTRFSQAITWTPADASGAALSLTINAANFFQQQAICIVTLDVTYPPTASANPVTIGPLPVNPASVYTNFQAQAPVLIGSTAEQTASIGFSAGLGYIQIINNSTGGVISNSVLSGKRITTQLVYFA